MLPGSRQQILTHFHNNPHKFRTKTSKVPAIPRHSGHSGSDLRALSGIPSAALTHDLHLQNIGAARGAQRQTAGDDHQIAVLHQIDLLGAIGGVDEQVVGGLLIMSESVPLVGKKSTVQTLEVAPHERRIPIL